MLIIADAQQWIQSRVTPKLPHAQRRASEDTPQSRRKRGDQKPGQSDAKFPAPVSRVVRDNSYRAVARLAWKWKVSGISSVEGPAGSSSISPHQIPKFGVPFRAPAPLEANRPTNLETRFSALHPLTRASMQGSAWVCWLRRPCISPNSAVSITPKHGSNLKTIYRHFHTMSRQPAIWITTCPPEDKKPCEARMRNAARFGYANLHPPVTVPRRMPISQDAGSVDSRSLLSTRQQPASPDMAALRRRSSRPLS